MECISIIVPAKNAEKTLKESVSTILHQTYKELEVVIIDDGSTDNTAAIADSIQNEDNRVKVVHIENAGVSNARNVGLRHCKGRFVAFMDSDDAMQSDMIEKLSSEMELTVDLVCSGYKVVNSEGKGLFSQNPLEGRWNSSCYDEAIGILQNSKSFNILWNKLFRKDIIDNYNIKMNTNVSMGEDFLFVVKYLRYIKNDIKICQEDLYRYTLSEEGLQAKKNDTNNLSRRLDQLYELRKFYDLNGYALDTIHMEELRCIYTSLSETNDIRKIANQIYGRDEYKELIKGSRNYGMKYSLFLIVLKTHNYILIKLLLYFFKKTKQLSGKVYKWN